MSRLLLSICLTLSCCALCTIRVYADDPPAKPAVDILRLENGQELTGESLGLREGALNWKSQLGHELLIPLDVVEGLDYNVPTREENGWADDARDARYAQALAVEKPSRRLGLFEFENFSLRNNIWNLTGGIKNLFTQSVQETAQWTKRIGLGGRFVDGNNNQDFFNVEGIFERSHEHRQTQLELGGQYSQVDGDRSSNRWYGNATADFSQERDWIFFVTAKNEHDEFERLDYRGTLSGGLGFRFFNEKKKRLFVRLGPAVTYESYTDDRQQRTSPDVQAELESRWPLLERVDYENKATVYPNVENFERFRLVNVAGFLLRLDQHERWRLKLGLRIEYDTDTGEDQENTDYTSNISLVYTRK